MTFALGLGASLRALTAARLGIQTASHNVANANTPGFSRQRVSFSSSQPIFAQGFQIGSGVEIGEVRRIVDDGLIARIYGQNSLVGSSQARYERLLSIESLFGSDVGGLGETFNGFLGSLSALQANPGDRAFRGGVVQSAQAFTSGLNLIGNGLSSVSETTFDEVRGLAQSVESLAVQLAALNDAVVQAESSGSPANDLRDQREQVAREIASLVDVRQVDRASGALDLIVGGRLLVAGGRSSEVQVTRNADGLTELRIGSEGATADVEGGRIGALLQLERTTGPSYRSRVDAFVRDFTLAFDRLHTTGTPESGPFRTLVSDRGAQDTNGNGILGDELLSQLGLPFDIQTGELRIRVVNESSRDARTHTLRVDPSSTTLADFAAQIEAIPALSGSVDSTGRLRIQAQTGFGFDFSPAIDAQPDDLDVFGGARPSVSTGESGPFDLSALAFPATFTIDDGTTTQVVTLDNSDFEDPTRVTADELAAAIEADASNIDATAADGRVVIQGLSAGAVAEFTLTDGAGSPLAAIGFPSGTYRGQDTGVTVTVGGAYDGATNRSLRVVANGDGEIGVTPGLTVDVFDEEGTLLGTLDVGAGYDGSRLPLADGVTVAFGQGRIRATANESFGVDLVADSDTSDILVALGLNTFFSGDATASTVSVRQEVLDDPNLFSASRNGNSGNAENLLAFESLLAGRRSSLGDVDFEDFIGDLIADIGFETARAERTFESQERLSQDLEQQRLAVSGVDLDEELLNLNAYQQAFEAASRLISVMQEVTDTLINLGSPR
ncbi:MAG: flagellar hook-associated protein FlgK [Planctomycetota bacterium]